jgi:riboflavin kinase/FMN adenylyltransferase
MNTMVGIREALSVSLDAHETRGLLTGHDQLRRLFTHKRGLRLLTSATAVPNEVKGSVMLLGNFDGFHRGHRTLLAEARSESISCGGLPIGAMSVEPHPKQFFTPHLDPFRLTTPSTKREMFDRLGLDFLYSPQFDGAFAGLEPEQFIDQVLVSGFAVARVIVGRSFRFGRQRRGDVDMLRCFGERFGFSVTAVGELEQEGVTCSSTLVRSRIAAGDIEAANTLLGGEWGVELDALSPSLLTTGEGSVTWPTSVMRPACGVYEVAVRRAGSARILSLGRLAVSSASTHLTLCSPEYLKAMPHIVDFSRRSQV